MIEKTFLEQPFDFPLAARSNKRAENAAVRLAALTEKRNRVSNYIAAMLHVNKAEINLLDGLDVWDANMGRYSGYVEVSGSTYRFVSQSYKSEDKVLTHFILENK